MKKAQYFIGIDLHKTVIQVCGVKKKERSTERQV